MKKALSVLFTLLTAALAAEEPEFKTFVEIEEQGVFKIVSSELAKTNASGLFSAFIARQWPEGYVPLFAVDREKTFELRRRQPRGQENFMEPAFFAMPLAHETNALHSGRWIVEATREDGSKPFLGWDLAVEGDKASGRLDQDTDYRHAFVTGGTLRSNTLELNIDYINDKFFLLGSFKTNGFKGTWTKLDKSETGDWVAYRPPPQTINLPGAKLVPLYQWRHPTTGMLRYRTEARPLDQPWKRQEAICLVWESKQE